MPVTGLLKERKQSAHGEKSTVVNVQQKYSSHFMLLLLHPHSPVNPGNNALRKAVFMIAMIGLLPTTEKHIIHFAFTVQNG